MPEDTIKLLKATPLAQEVDLENKMTMREKQKAKRKTKELTEEEFTKQTGIRKPLTTYEEQREKFYYDMVRMELKE